jgi:hypothetical protein
MDEWVEDDFLWAARKCTYPFHSREKFLEHFSGANILLAGDSTVSARNHRVQVKILLLNERGLDQSMGANIFGDLKGATNAGVKT